MIKAGSTQLDEQTVKKAYEENKYICNYSGIYQIHYSQSQKQYYTHKVIEYKGYAKKGRFYIQDAKTINHVFGKHVLNEN